MGRSLKKILEEKQDFEDFMDRQIQMAIQKALKAYDRDN